MGVIYEAVQTKLNRRVCLKVLPESFNAYQISVDSFQREAEAMAKLQHPGIVQIYGIGREGDIHYYSMEYVEGKSLSRIMEEGMLSLERVCQIIQDAAVALDYVHQHGVIETSNLLMLWLLPAGISSWWILDWQRSKRQKP